MQQRRILSLKRPDPEAETARDPQEVIREALAKRRCIAATYNRQRAVIAPHILYTRHDDPFVDGVVVSRDGKPPRELKLSSFKLAGLGDVAASRAGFIAFPEFAEGDERYQGTTLALVRPLLAD
jgi:hypothetical protein